MKHIKKLLKDPLYFGATILRIAFALLFILVAVKKFRMGYGGFAEGLVAAEDLLSAEIPHALLYAYGYIIPAAEFIFGVMLLFNFHAKKAYLGIALIYLSFVFGQQYNGNTAKVGTEYLPSLLVLVAAYYMHHKAGGKN